MVASAEFCVVHAQCDSDIVTYGFHGKVSLHVDHQLIKYWLSREASYR